MYNEIKNVYKREDVKMEQIYTIPINEAFEKSMSDPDAGCPFCTIRKVFEENELSLILGASMMEPDVRIKTNELGFCERHFKKMLAAGKRLPLALILESHLDTVSENMQVSRILPAKSAKATSSNLEKLTHSCYICDRLDASFSKVMENAVYLFATDADFRKKCSKQPHFCIPHYAMFLKAARENLKGSDFSDLYKCISTIENKYLTKLKGNVSHFIKKFDYRYEDEPWGDAKDAVEKAISALIGGEELS